MMLSMEEFLVVYISFMRHAHVGLALCSPLGSKILRPFVAALSTYLLDDFVRHD